MLELFKCHANGAAIYSDGQETHLLFLLRRPSIDEDGKIILVGEEQALISMPFEYIKILRDALDKNIKEHEEKLAKDINGGE